jgi:hypothetical protein
VRRLALLTAILAALLWAPSAALATPPNWLEAPMAEPTDGTPLTAFQFSVRYLSTAGNPASGVSAHVGSLEILLQLTSGSATEGTWTGGSLLPVGTWNLTFHAVADQGPSPSLAGPTLSVAGTASPRPGNDRPGSQEPAPAPSSGGDDVAGPGREPTRTPAGRPAESGEPAADANTPAPAPDGGNATDASASGTPGAAPQSSERGSRDGRRHADAAPRHRSPRGMPAADEAPPGGDPTESQRADLLLVLAAIVSVSTVGLVGTGWMLASRERREEAVAGEPGEAAGGGARGARLGGGVHRARDPVLAALGLDDTDGESHQPLRGAARGAAPRPRKAPRPRR